MEKKKEGKQIRSKKLLVTWTSKVSNEPDKVQIALLCSTPLG